MTVASGVRVTRQQKGVTKVAGECLCSLCGPNLGGETSSDLMFNMLTMAGEE